MCAKTVEQNEFARDVVANPCRSVPLIATKTDTCTKFADNVVHKQKATEHIAADTESEL